MILLLTHITFLLGGLAFGIGLCIGFGANVLSKYRRPKIVTTMQHETGFE